MLGAGRRAARLRCPRAQRVVQAERRRDHPVHREQVPDHSGDRRPARPAAFLLEPLQPDRGLPFGVAEVAQQRVQPRRLGVVRARPRRDRDAGGPLAEAVLQHPRRQQRLEVEALLRVQQPDRVAQPQRLLRAGRALGEVLLHRLGLLGGAGGQRPCAEQGLQHGVRAGLRERAGRCGARRLQLRLRLRLRLRRGRPARVEVVGGPARARYARRAAGLLLLASVGCVVSVVGRLGGAVHRGVPYPGGAASSCGRALAVDSSCSPRRSRRRASSSLICRSAAASR